MKGIAIYPALVMPALVTRDLVHRRRTACFDLFHHHVDSDLPARVSVSVTAITFPQFSLFYILQVLVANGAS